LSAKEENDIRPKKRKRERKKEALMWLLSLLKKPDIKFKHQSIRCEKDDHSSIRNAPWSQVQPKCGYFSFIRWMSDWVRIETLKRGKTDKFKFHHNNLDPNAITNLLSPTSSKHNLISLSMIMNQCV